MNTKDVQVGSTITNGSSAMRITEKVSRDPRYRAPGWRGLCIPLEEFGGNAGMTDFVPDYLLGSWRHVPFEWSLVLGSRDLEERYVWTADWRRLQREVRRRPFAVGDKVVPTDWDEPPGEVLKVQGDLVWVETPCNMYRAWTSDAFRRAE